LLQKIVNNIDDDENKKKKLIDNFKSENNISLVTVLSDTFLHHLIQIQTGHKSNNNKNKK
jgi:hypothetical protein